MGQRADEHLMSPSPGKFMSTLFLTGPSCWKYSHSKFALCLLPLGQVAQTDGDLR